jgi:hypothetical protein
MICEWFGLKTTRTVFAGLTSKPVATVCERFGIKPTQMVFAGLASKPVVTVSSGLASKPAATVFTDLASKPVVTVSSSLASKPDVTIFPSLASKLVATVCPSFASKLVVGLLVEPQNQGGGGFPGLGLKTGSSGLVIWASKSLRRFPGLGLKTDGGMSVCRLLHKIDGGRSARDTHRDLAACLAWKQVWLGFSSLA